MEKKIIDVRIDELVLTRKGPVDGAEDTIAVKISLQNPAEGVPLVETLKVFKPKDIDSIDWSGDLTRASIWKTPIRGVAPLTVEVVTVDADSEAEKKVLGIVKNLGALGLTIATGGIASPLLSGAATIAGNSLLETLETSDDAYEIGRAEIELDSENLSDRVKAPLKVLEAVPAKTIVTNTGPRRTTRSVRRRTDVSPAIPVGENGRVALRVLTLA